MLGRAMESELLMGRRTLRLERKRWKRRTTRGWAAEEVCVLQDPSIPRLTCALLDRAQARLVGRIPSKLS